MASPEKTNLGGVTLDNQSKAKRKKKQPDIVEMTNPAELSSETAELITPEISVESVGQSLIEGQNLSGKDLAFYNEHAEDVSKYIENKILEKIGQMQKNIQDTSIELEDTAGLDNDTKTSVDQINQDTQTKLDGAKQAANIQIEAEQNKLVFRAGVVDVTDMVDKQARYTADEQMTADKKELSGWSGFFKKIFKFGYGEQVLHEKKRLAAKENIIRENNIYSNESLTDTEKSASSRSFCEATVGRFITQTKGLVETNLGERQSELQTNTPEEQRVKGDLKKIIDDYADGKLDEAGFEGAKRQIFADIKNLTTQNTLDKGEMYVDNFLEIAKEVKRLKSEMISSAGHSITMDKLEYDIVLVLGKAKSGIKTETHYNWAEKAIEKLRQTKLGSLVNETTLALGVAAVASVMTGTSKIVSSKVAAAVTFGLSAGVAGVFAAGKESQMQKRERKTLEIRETIGASNIQDQLNEIKSKIVSLKVALNQASDKQEIKRINRELRSQRAEESKLEDRQTFIYNRCSAKDLTSSLHLAMQQNSYEEIMRQLTEVEARLDISNGRNIDLISYSKLTAVEEERSELLQLSLQAKTWLADFDKTTPPAVPFADHLQALVSERTQELMGEKGGVDEKDKSFNKLKNKAMAKKAFTQLAVGLAVGVVAQEAYSFATDNQEGLVENLVKGDNRILGAKDSVLQSLHNYISGSSVPESLQSSIVPNGLVKLPASCSWLANADGSFSIKRGEEVLADNLRFNPNGSLTNEAKGILANSGISVAGQESFMINGDEQSTGQNGNRTIEEFIDQHPLGKKVSRDFWLGNDTPMYQGPDGQWHGADLNELRFDFGGTNGSGINEQCNAYELSAVRMTSDGSFQTINGEMMSEDAKALLNSGQLKVLFTLSDGTQDRVIELSVDRYTGLVQVDRDSELGKLLFTEKDGQAVLRTKFMEVAVVSGQLEDGTQKVRILATAVGEGLTEVPSEVPSAVLPIENTVTTLGLNRAIAAPPFIPIVERTPLEPLPLAHPDVIYYGPYSEQPVSKEKKKELDSRLCQALENDPGAELDQFKEVGDYLERLDKDYFKQVRDLADQAGKMGSENRLSICIPVAGHQEGGNIYESLKNYTYQQADLDSFEICLLVNHPDKDRQGNIVKPDNTLLEIERFKQDFPALQVKVMYTVLPEKKAKIGLVRKLLSDAVLIRQHDRGEGAEDLIMVSNDADNLGVDPRYVQNFIKRFSENKKLDGILGQIDWDSEAYIKYPLIHVGTRMFQYNDAYHRKMKGRIPSSGANFAYRASIYAGIGGYMEGESVGEDVLLGQGIALARGDSENGERTYNFDTQTHGGSASRLFTSARRAIEVLEKEGLAPIEQWNQSFSPFDDLRKKKLSDSVGDKIDYNNKKWLATFKTNLESIINRTLDMTGVVYGRENNLKNDDDEYRKIVIGGLGIKYKLDSQGKVVITDMSKLIKGLKKYQEDGVLRRDLRSGKKAAQNQAGSSAEKKQSATKAKAEKKSTGKAKSSAKEKDII